MIIVSSGAVAVGCQRMELKQKPTELAKKQALAAVGQVHLMRFYEDLLSALNLVRVLNHRQVPNCIHDCVLEYVHERT